MRWQAEEGGEGFWNPEQLDRDRASRWGTGIASQSLLPREAVVSSLRTGKRQWLIHQEGGESSSHQYLQMLMAQKLHTHSSMLSPAPVTPEEGGRADDERVEQHAHLARLGGGTAIPLALLAQRTGTATADTGSIDHAQASIGFSAPFMREQVLTSRTPERAIGLKRKVGSGETPRFAGCGRGRWTVSRDRS